MLKLSNLPAITQLVRGGSRIRTKIKFQRLHFTHSTYPGILLTFYRMKCLSLPIAKLKQNYLLARSYIHCENSQGISVRRGITLLNVRVFVTLHNIIETTPQLNIIIPHLPMKEIKLGEAYLQSGRSWVWTWAVKPVFSPPALALSHASGGNSIAFSCTFLQGLNKFFSPKNENNHYSRYHVQQCHLLKVMRQFSTQNDREPGFWSLSNHWSALQLWHGQVTHFLPFFSFVMWERWIKWALSSLPAFRCFESNGSFTKVALGTALSIITLNMG